MYPIQNEAKALFESERKQLIRITGKDRNGTSINITEANVMQDGFSIDRYSCNGKKLEIGTAIASEMTLKLDNRLGQFDSIYFEGAELFVEIGIANWDADLVDWTTNTTANVTTNDNTKLQFDISNAIYWIPCGYFTPDEQPRRLSTITLKALDRMTKFDIIQHALLPWTDNNGNVITDNQLEPFYFCTELVFPATIKSIIEQACIICGVPLATDLTTLPGYNIEIASMPVIQGDITFRNLIQWCAGIMATNAWIDWDGKLRFSWYDNTTGYTTTIANRFDSDLYENDVQITGVMFTDIDEDKTVYLAGTDSYAIDLSGNALINADSAQVILNGVYEVVHNYAYRPFTATIINAPYLWPMDKITFTDKAGSGHVTTITNINFTVNNNASIAACGETIQTNSYASPNGFTSQQATILQNMRRVNSEDLNNAVDNATAIITGAHGGNIRYIYDGNGNLTEIVIMDTDNIATATKVWRWNSGGLGYSSNGYNGPYTIAMTQDGSIVADFISSGVMSADVVRAGILTDTAGQNYWDLDNGIFRLAGNATLDGKQVSQLISDVNATISSVDVEFAHNQSAVEPPTEGWSTTAPTWAAGYYIWQRTKTVSPSGTSYSEPTCISGRDGSASTPGLNQATIYLYRRATSQPSKPNVTTSYVFVSGVLSPIPEGWSRGIPNGSDPCWVTSASAISTETMDNIAASEWLTPTKMAENGLDGSSVDTVVDYYAVSGSTVPPDDSEFWTPGVANVWMDNYGNIMRTGGGEEIDFTPPAVPVPTEIDPYVWQYQLTTYTDGTSTKSNKYISSVLGASGVGIDDIIEEYYLSTSAMSQIGGEWSVEQPVWAAGFYIWTRTVITWSDGEVTNTAPVLAKAINGANSTANDAVGIANDAVEHANNLDASLDQSGVFNRLTNGGQIQGIFLENNKLYLNGTYMKTGTLDASLCIVINLDASKITTGTLDAERIGAGSIAITQMTNAAQSALAGNITSKMQYYLSTSYDSATGDTWRDNIPTTWTSGRYVWTRIATSITSANGTARQPVYSTEVYDANLTYALSTANTAQSTANTAVTNAANAQSTADSAASAASAAQSTADSAASAASAAQTSANTAQSTADSAVYREQVIYKSVVSGTTSLPTNTMWVIDTTGNQNTWTTTRPVYNQSYPVLFTAIQRQSVAQYNTSGSYQCSCTAPVVDQTTTVIDGGHITTGSIDAGMITTGTLDGNVVNVAHINASNISAGTMSANYISGGTIDGNTVNAKLLQIVDGNGNVIASFNNAIILGQTGDLRTEIDFNSFSMYDKDNNKFIDLGDFRNVNGYVEMTDTFAGKGQGAGYDLTVKPSTIISVKVDGVEVEYTYYPTANIIGGLTPPAYSSNTVTVEYRTTEPYYHYDLGIRRENTVKGLFSYCLGFNVEAHGKYSYAEGAYTKARGYGSHAEGVSCEANGSFSHAEGRYTIANGDCQHVFGQYNVPVKYDSGGYRIVEVVGYGQGLNYQTNIRTLNEFGNLWILGGYSNQSDQRLKTETGEVPDVSDIKARRFKWNDKKPNHDDKEHIGYFAQDVEEVAPYLVDEDAMGYKSLDYNGILVAKIASLERRIADLEKLLSKEGSVT